MSLRFEAIFLLGTFLTLDGGVVRLSYAFHKLAGTGIKDCGQNLSKEWSPGDYPSFCLAIP